jgi:SAM-dependent methyltransferase
MGAESAFPSCGNALGRLVTCYGLGLDDTGHTDGGHGELNQSERPYKRLTPELIEMSCDKSDIKPPYFRTDTTDEWIWDSVVSGTEYGTIPRFHAHDIVMDIGCHIGSFSFLALSKIGRGTSAVSVEFSRDPTQRFIDVVNQNQREVDILNRATGEVVSTIGHGTGLFFPGQLFDAIRDAVDSKGNVYVAEDEGRRLQKFKAVGP